MEVWALKPQRDGGVGWASPAYVQVVLVQQSVSANGSSLRGCLELMHEGGCGELGED